MTGAFITLLMICLALTSLAWALWRAYRTQVKEREGDQHRWDSERTRAATQGLYISMTKERELYETWRSTHLVPKEGTIARLENELVASRYERDKLLAQVKRWEDGFWRAEATRHGKPCSHANKRKPTGDPDRCQHDVGKPDDTLYLYRNRGATLPAQIACTECNVRWDI